MANVFRKNSKKILAIIGVFLMIAFILPNVSLPGQGDSGAVGRIGDEEIELADYRRAQNDFQLLQSLRQSRVTALDRAGLYNVMELSLSERLAAAFASFYGPQFAEIAALPRAQQIVAGLDPLSYLLLLREADRMNVRVSRDLVQEEITRLGPTPADPAMLQRAITNWLRILETFDRVAAAVRVSPAAGIHDVAADRQQVSLRLVEFDAESFRFDIPSPTPEQLQAHFEKYRDEDPETSEDGIGYRFPNRVKLDYIIIPINRFREQVRMEDIYRFWRENQELFTTDEPPSTQPASTQPTADEPAAPPATLPTTIAATGPTTRPMEEVADEIRDRLARQYADTMVRNILQTFRQDWPGFREATRAAPATIPADAPPTSLGVPYHTDLYLSRLITQIQSLRPSRGVLPELRSHATLLSRKELANLTGIGSAVFNSPQGPIRFPDLAIELAAPFMSEAARKQAAENVLLLYQPSPPLVNETTGDYYIFRLTAAEPAHPAPGLEVVESQARQDWIRLQALDFARQAARQVLEQARAQGLQQAANAAGNLSIVETGLFSNEPGARIENYDDLPDADRADFLEAGVSLLHERLRTGSEHPIGLIELKRARKILVSELDNAQPARMEQFFELQVFQAQAQRGAQRTAELLIRWFEPAAIEQRLDYAPETGAAPRQDRDPLGPRPPLL